MRNEQNVEMICHTERKIREASLRRLCMHGLWCLLAGALTAYATTGLAYAQVTEREWTVLVYVDGDNNLEGAAIDDLNEMEVAGSSPEVNIVVQVDRIPGYDASNGDWATCKRFYVMQDEGGYNSTIVSTEIADLGERNMGDPATLVEFAQWGKDNYPAQHYALVLWDHGNGWKLLGRSTYQKNVGQKDFDTGDAVVDPSGIGWDDTSGGDYITTPELRSALQSIYTHYGTKMDILGLDACLMGMLEIDYELAPFVDYRVGSEETEPWDGWDYEASMAWLVGNPTATAEQLAQQLVNDYGNFYGAGSNTTQSAVDLATIRQGSLASELHILASHLRSDISSHWFAIERARGQAQEYADTDYIDLYHFAELLKADSDDSTIQADAQRVMDALAASVVAEYHGSFLPDSHGVSIYFPSCDGYDAKYHTDCLLSVDTDWNDLILDYCNTSPDCGCIDPSEDFETGDLSKLPWATGGAASWSTTNSESNSPSHSVRSGNIEDYEISYLEVTRDVPAGNVLFCHKVSSEANYDFLRFYIDGEEKGAWSGVEDWSLGNASVTAGIHTFRWAYEKDYSVSNWSDAAWIDDIEFPDTEAAFRVEATGDVHAAAAFYGTGFYTGSADVAEWVKISEGVTPGDVLIFDRERTSHYRSSQEKCSTLVAGVVSTTPGVVLGSPPTTPLSLLTTFNSQALLALIGIVPVKATNEGGPILPGDLLITSSTPGHAMRWAGPEPCPCSLVGKALEPMTDEQGMILVLLTAH
ncbi:clostripain-related cysteine peptidase [Candidatus Bipolaricaulota bacterium]